MGCVTDIDIDNSDVESDIDGERCAVKGEVELIGPEVVECVNISFLLL